MGFLLGTSRPGRRPLLLYALADCFFYFFPILPGYTSFIDSTANSTSGMIVAIIILLGAAVAAFILTYITYSDEPAKAKSKV